MNERHDNSHHLTFITSIITTFANLLSLSLLGISQSFLVNYL